MEQQKNKKPIADRDIAGFISTQLRAGVIASCMVAIIGGILYLVQHGNAAVPNYSVFKGPSECYTSMTGIIHGIAAFDAGAVIQAGIIILIATPIIRVALSLFSFGIEKDWMYVVITCIVLAIISTSLFGGLKL